MLKSNVFCIIFCAILSFYFSTSCCQSVTFNKILSFDNSAAIQDAAQIIEVEDGYIMYGCVFGINKRLVIAKLNYTGDTLWSKKYGSARRYFSPGYYDSMIKTSDSNFVVALSYFDTVFSSHPRIMVLKFDKNGDTLWSKQVYTPGQEDVTCCAGGVIETLDKGFLVYGGEGASWAVLLKTDSLGNLEWKKYYGYNQRYNICSIFSARQLADSGYIVTAEIRDTGNNNWADPMLVRYDKHGVKQWEKALGGPKKDYSGMFIQATQDSNFVVITHYTTEDSGHPYYIPTKNKLQVAKINDNGNILQSYLVGDEDEHLEVNDLEPIEDGSFIACGQNCDYISWIYNFSLEKDSLYFRMLKIPAKMDFISELYDVKYCSDGGLIACGFFDDLHHGQQYDHPWIIKTDRFACFTPGCDSNGVYTLNQPVPATTCKNKPASLSLEAYNSSGNVNYNWQSFQNNTWQNLEDSIIYHGIQENVLNINSSYIDSPKEFYRCHYYNEIWSLFTDSVTVDFLDTLNIITQPENQSVQYGEPASFATLASGEYPVDYQWYHGTLALGGSTDSILQINHVYVGDTGSYYCMLRNECGRIRTDTVSLSINDLGIKDGQCTPGIFISPNPTNSLLRICSTEKIYIESLILTDLTGKPFSANPFGVIERLDYTLYINDLPGGVYLLIIQTDQERITRKIVKL